MIRLIIRLWFQWLEDTLSSTNHSKFRVVTKFLWLFLLSYWKPKTYKPKIWMLLLKSLGLASIHNLQTEQRGKRKMDVPKVLPSQWDLRAWGQLKPVVCRVSGRWHARRSLLPPDDFSLSPSPKPGILLLRFSLTLSWFHLISVQLLRAHITEKYCKVSVLIFCK